MDRREDVLTLPEGDPEAAVANPHDGAQSTWAGQTARVESVATL